MTFGIGFRQFGADLVREKLRAFLTIFGIVWGTAAVSLLLAFGEGFQHQIVKAHAGIGENIVIAWPSRTSLAYEGLGKGRRIALTAEDMALLRRETRGLAGVSGEMEESMKLDRGERSIGVQVSGVEPEFGPMRRLDPRTGGRFLNPIDEARSRRVLFLGDTLAGDLFGAEDPVGATVLLQGLPFTVVGVLEKKLQESSYSVRDTDKAYIPASAFRAITGREVLENFVFQAADPAGTPALRDEVIRILARKHRFDPADKEALAIWDTTEGMRFLGTFLLGFRAFLGVVGSLTLLVGGIGVSNIMNVVVEERTREIGIKMALGARPRWILRQILFETAAITALGGLLGIAITAGICAAFPLFGAAKYVGTPHVSPLVASCTAAILGVVALGAGWFPARDAARLDPVAAMRS